MKRIGSLLYNLTVIGLCILIGVNIARNPAGFRNIVSGAVSNIGAVTADVLDGIFNMTHGQSGAGGSQPENSAAGSVPGATPGGTGQPAPVLPQHTPTPSAVPSQGSAATDASAGFWGQTGVTGLKVYEYGKSLLTAGDERACYDKLAAGILNVDSRITIRTGLTPATVEKIVDYYLYDHAEVFYASSAGMSYTYTTSGSRTVYKSYTITPNYTYDKNTVIAMRAQMGAAAAPFLQAADGKATDYRKELALHDAIVDGLSYDRQAAEDPASRPQSFTSYGAFVNKTAVCEGYAKALKLLLDSAEVESVYVTGTASNGAETGAHAWNMARVGAQWYYLDATFDDPVVVTPSGKYVGSSRPDYTYFNFKSKPDHVLGHFNEAEPFAQESQNYAVMPAAE